MSIYMFYSFLVLEDHKDYSLLHTEDDPWNQLLCIHALYVHTCLGIAYNQLSLLLDCLKFLMNQNKSKILRILITTTPFCRWTLNTCSLYFASKIPVKMKPLCGKQKVTRKVASNNTEEMLAFSKRPEQIKESIHLIKKRTLVLVF